MDSATQVNGYTAAWTAPEILKRAGTTTREADVFAFGMVVIEVGQRFLSPLALEVEDARWLARCLNPAQGLYRKTPVQSILNPDRYFNGYGW